jgi:hypothetical protein
MSVLVDPSTRWCYSMRGAATPSESPASVPAPAATFSFANSPALAQETGACSAQTGRELQLGVQVTNQSTEPLTLQRAGAVLPMGGLRQVTQQWAPCGALPADLSQADNVLQPGASTWLTVTFKVQVRCPAPLSRPVRRRLPRAWPARHSPTARLPRPEPGPLQRMPGEHGQYLARSNHRAESLTRPSSGASPRSSHASRPVGICPSLARTGGGTSPAHETSVARAGKALAGGRRPVWFTPGFRR